MVSKLQTSHQATAQQQTVLLSYSIHSNERRNGSTKSPLLEHLAVLRWLLKDLEVQGPNLELP